MPQITAPGTLEEELAAARACLRRVLDRLEQSPADQDLSGEQFAELADLAFTGARTVARLLRDRRALTGEAGDGICAAIGQALDELATELGIKL